MTPWDRFEQEARRGHRLERGDLRFVILSLLEDHPSYGYELIRALEDRFHGFYSPSPGTIYPTLQWLEDLGYVIGKEQDGRKIYAITDEGRRFLAASQPRVDEIFTRLRGWWSPFDKKEWRDEMHDFMHDMQDMVKDLRHEARWADPAKLRRVREVVMRAGREIDEILREPSARPGEARSAGAAASNTGPAYGDKPRETPGPDAETTPGQPEVVDLLAPEVVQLDDGTRLVIRAIRPDDAPRLQALGARLSPETIFRRFRAPLRSLPDAEAARLAEVDYDLRMAFVATREPEGCDDIVGVVRYAAAGAAPEPAEVAVLVEDAYQARGLGLLLIRRLAAYARTRGIDNLAAVVAPGNDSVLRLLQHIEAPTETQSLGYGERLLRFPLNPPNP